MDSEDGLKAALLRKNEVGDEGRGESGLQDLKASLAHVTDVWRAKASGKHAMFTFREDERYGWQKTLADALESTYMHVFLVSLLLIDLLATAIDILKTIHNKSHDLGVCTTYLEACQCVSHFDKSEEWVWTYWISIAILCVLFLNVVGLMVAFGLNFFRHPGYVLDLVVVTTALALEIFLDAETVGLLVILSLWRIVRVAHGIFEVTDEAWEEEIHGLESKIQGVETAHEKDNELLRQRENRIAELEAQLASYT